MGKEVLFEAHAVTFGVKKRAIKILIGASCRG